MKPWLVLLAHGSRDAEWRAPFDQLTADAQASLTSVVVRLAFLQLAEPTLEEIVAEAARVRADTITVVPLFMAQGRHVTVDIERLMNDLNEVYPEIELKLRTHIGSDARLWTLMREIVIESFRQGAQG